MSTPDSITRPDHSDALRPKPVAARPARATPAWAPVVGSLMLPLFFVVMFAFCYISAFHAPRPTGAPIVLVGPEAQTSAIKASILDASPDSFSITTTSSADVAINRIANRDAIGAIELGQTITAHVASAAGPSTSAAVQSLATRIAAQSGTTVTVDDSVPLSNNDPTGTALFYFLIICTIAGYLTITVLSQAAPKQKLSARYGILAGTAIIAPVLVFAISSIFVGSYGASVGSILAMLAIGTVYTFTIGSLAILANQLIGQAAIFLVMTVVIFLNFPSSGGAIPATFLPEFWQAIHSFWVGSAAMEPIRSIIYFDGAAIWPWLAHLGIWLIATLALSAVVGTRKNAKTTTPAPAEHHRHLDTAPAGGSTPVAVG